MHRKRNFDTIEAMQAAIDKYKKVAKRDKRPLTIQGLALALGFTSRQSLLNYEGYTDLNDKCFLDTIKKAKLEIEMDKVEGAMSGDYNNAIVIFDLKNNHGHKDKQEIAHEGSIEQTKPDYSNLEEDELRKLIEITAKLNGTKSGTSEA